MQKMSHKERIKAVLEGKPTDRIPYAAWGPHMNLVDRHEGDFTKACIAYQDQYQFDVFKIMSNGLYNIEDLGQKFALPQHPDDFGYKLSTEAAFNCVGDWVNFTKKDPCQGTMGREVRVVRNLYNYYKDSVPILPTIFGPSRTLSGLSSGAGFRSFITEGGRTLRDVVLENEAAYCQVMEALTEQVIDLMNAFVEAGAAGFFYCAGGDVSRDDNGYKADGFNTEEYYKYVRVYDDKVLNAMEGKTWFNMVHIHGDSNLRMEELVTLPNIQAINWEDQSPYNPSLAQVRAMTDKVLMGGIDRNNDFNGPYRDKIKSILRMKVDEAVRQAGPKLIVAVGCEAPRVSNYRFSVWEEVLDDIAAGR